MITVNWSDETFRKPTNIVTVNGTKGKIIADKHAYKIYLKDPDPSGRFQNGWNTIYITEFAESVRFYLRGNEFTRQLDYFVDCMQNKQTENICSFSDALQTDVVMDWITRDAARSLAEDTMDINGADHLLKQPKQKTFWGNLKAKVFGA